ncbi:MAG: MFS transporter [Chloroflexi bacterium]|nr:MFS transporter [Chloroflexota bacterium]
MAPEHRATAAEVVPRPLPHPSSLVPRPFVSAAREPLWTRDYALTIASLHLFFLSWALLFATLPLHLGDAPRWQVGWVIGGAYGLVSLAVRPFSGRFTDRWGRRPVILIGAGLAAGTIALHALTSDPWLLTPIRLVYGAGMCLYTTAAMAALADALPASRRGEGMGWYGVIYTLTNVYGP